jgi:hypothetical protein
MNKTAYLTPTYVLPLSHFLNVLSHFPLQNYFLLFLRHLLPFHHIPS